MPAIAEPPSTPKPAPKPSQAPAPPAPKPSPDPAPSAPKAEPKTPDLDPLPEVSNEDNEFFKMEKAMGMGRKKPEEPKVAAEGVEGEKGGVGSDGVQEKPATKPPEAKAEAPEAKTEGGRLRQELEKARKEVEDYKRKVTEYESKAAESKPSEEITSLTKRMAEIEKERDEARSEVAMLKEGETPEFKQKHQEPFNREHKRAVNLIKQLPVTGADGQVRAGTADDMALIYNLPFAAANEKAKEMFGDYAQNVMTHYVNLHGHDEDYREAREQQRSTWKETAAKRQAEATQQREAFNAGLAKAREGLMKKYSDRFADDGSDPEITKAMSEGERLWNKKPESFQEHVTKAAAVELAYKAHNRLVYQLSKHKAEIEALQAKLKEYEGSEPGSTNRKTEQVESGKQKLSAEEKAAELRNLLNNAR